MKQEKVHLDTVIELQYGLFFDQIASDIQFGKNIFQNSHLTPNWYLLINNKKIVVEVVSLNASADDQIQINFDHAINNSLSEIKKNIYLRLSDVTVFDPRVVDLKDFKAFVETWPNSKFHY